MTARAKNSDEGSGDEGITGGLEGREGSGLRLVLLSLLVVPSLLVVFDQLVYQERDGAFALGGFADFGGRGEGSEFGVSGDLFYGFGHRLGRGFGQIEAGDLEAVEKEAGAAGVNVVGGDALEDLADGELDGRSIFGEGDLEGGAAAPAGARVGGGLAGGVVVEAELFSAEAGAAAAVAVGDDVAASESFGWFGLRCVGLRLAAAVHWSLPQGYFLVQSLRKKRVRSGLPASGLPFSRLKAKARLFGRAAVNSYDLFYFYISILTKRMELIVRFRGYIFESVDCSI
jgi:hypothetical protein